MQAIKCRLCYVVFERLAVEVILLCGFVGRSYGGAGRGGGPLEDLSGRIAVIKLFSRMTSVEATLSTV